MSDTQTEKRTKPGGGRPFHSRLEPFVDFIREQRRRRKTWQEIAGLLRAEKGCPITFQGVHQFYRRYVKRQARPHWECDAGHPPNPPTGAAGLDRRTVLAATPTARPFKYGYATGIEFRQRVEGVVEAFMTLRDDLESESRGHEHQMAATPLRDCGRSDARYENEKELARKCQQDCQQRCTEGIKND